MARVALALALGLLPAVATALPIDKYVTVQLITVCDGTSAANSTHCAPVSIDPSRDSYDFAQNPTAAITQAVWQQAGIAFAFLPTINKLYDASFLTTSVEDTPVDEAHVLLRGANHGQNAASRTLNMFFVDQLIAPLGAVYGYALRGSNGAVVSSAANVDTIAHELGHNFGLSHVDGTPWDSQANLMRSSGRFVPGSVGAVTGGLTDRLYTAGQGGGAPDQVGIARQPLFTVQGAEAGVQNLELIEREFYRFDLSVRDNGSGQTLQAIKIRYTSARQVLNGNIDELILNFGSCFVNGSARLINGTGAIGVFVGSRGDNLAITNYDKENPISGGLEVTAELDSACVAANPDIPFSVLANSTLPFSFEFDFSGGVTSTGLYDVTTGRASSTNPITVGFTGQPTFGLGEQPLPELPTEPGEVFDYIETAVPEPPMPWLAGLVGLAWFRTPRRRASASADLARPAPV